MKALSSKICVICGQQLATTNDHLPPKGIFPKPRPSDLISVRTCLSCNKSTSDIEEIFKVYIGFLCGHGVEGEKLFKSQTLKTLDHNRRLKRDLAGSLHDIWIQATDGVSERKAAVRFNTKPFDCIAEQTVRGIYFRQTGEILANRVDFKIIWPNKLTTEAYAISKKWPSGIVGGGQFSYRFLIHRENPLASIWILEFFNKTLACCLVLPNK